MICFVMMASISVAALRLRTSSLGGADGPTGATGGRVGARGGGLALVDAATDWPSSLSTLSLSCNKNFCFSLSRLTCCASCCPGYTSVTRALVIEAIEAAEEVKT